MTPSTPPPKEAQMSAELNELAERVGPQRISMQVNRPVCDHERELRNSERAERFARSIASLRAILAQ